MPKVVKPQVFIIGEPKIDPVELQEYLESVGVSYSRPPWWSPSDSDAEHLVEVYNRICYKSWEPGLNANVTRVRESTDANVKHGIASGHGSVLEHANINIIFHNVSRVFTHELVRHRHGAISQESMRYVRVEDIDYYLPEIFRALAPNEEIAAMAEMKLKDTFWRQERDYRDILELFPIDEMSFEYKKQLTSALRRVVGQGIVTELGWTSNFRELRHVITMRTTGAAEEEMQLVIGMLAEKLVKKFPIVFGDFECVDGTWLPDYSKV